MQKGLVIVIDGGNGAGKSSLIESLSNKLAECGYDIELSREPGGTHIGDSIRNIFLDTKNTNMNSITELMLLAAGRAQHVAEKLIPWREEGKIVICDRFDASTFAFQHFGRGISYEKVNIINEFAKGDFSPDINIILDIDPALGIDRINGSNLSKDRMDNEAMDFLTRARDGYLTIAKNNPNLFKVIDASMKAEDVEAKAFTIIEDIIAKKRK